MCFIVKLHLHQMSVTLPVETFLLYLPIANLVLDLVTIFYC